MKRVGRAGTKVIAGLVMCSAFGLAQNYTVSARPGAVNYIEGEAAINGKFIQAKSAGGRTFLNTNDTLTTDNGRVEFLLTPGVFVRVGEDSQVRMVSPDLTSTRIEVAKGSAIVEVDQLLKENDIEILDTGATIRLQKAGLYLFTAGTNSLVQVFDGKAAVSTPAGSLDVGKNHQVALEGSLKREKIQGDAKDTPLYAWSKIRDEYDAATSYASARTMGPSVDPYGSGFNNGYGYRYGGFAPGWAWNPFWSSYAWIPGDGAFFSPYGYGFYAPVYAVYAPVVVSAVGGKPVPVPVTTSKPGVATGTYRSGYFSGQPIRPGRPIAASQTAVSRGGYAPQAGYVGAPRAAAPSAGTFSHTAPSGGFSHASSGGSSKH